MMKAIITMALGALFFLFSQSMFADDAPLNSVEGVVNEIIRLHDEIEKLKKESPQGPAFYDGEKLVYWLKEKGWVEPNSIWAEINRLISEKSSLINQLELK